MKTRQNTVKAHSEQQFNKWKDYLNGLYTEEDLYLLAQTYINEIIFICRSNNISRYEETDKTIFTLFANSIEI